MKICLYILSFISIQITSKIEEIRVDPRKISKSDLEKGQKDFETLQKFNLAMPYTEEYTNLMRELFYNQIGENSIVNNQLTVVVPKNVKIGNGVTIMNGVLIMGIGGITIEDNVMIAAHAKLISNNHDPYDRIILTCKPVLIKEGAWIGAGATILPGVTVGKYAIVGASSVVTKDVPDYAVVIGSPAKIKKYLNKDKFKKVKK